MATYTPNFNLSKPEPTDEYQDFLDSYGDNMDIIDLNMGGGGGGGGHTIVDPTGTDMPQESKLQFTGAVNVSDDAVNGMTVVDVEGGGNYYLNTIYSTEEKKVGYYVDGKPLYQKSINIGAVASNNVKVIDITSLNVDSVADYIATAVLTNGWKVPLPQTHTSSFGYQAFCRLSSSTQLAVGVGSSIGISDGYVTLQYTKTTDTPELNPQTGGVIYLPSIYSEEEREIGVWTDGKPLYQKTVNFGTLPSSTGSHNYSHNISNVDKIWINDGFAINSGGTSIPLNWARPDGAITDEVGCNVTRTNIVIRVGYDRSSFNGYVTLCYTKTTDTAGSGSWTPSGANAVHYSTNEQVIGTWVDSKPLYQKTIDCGALPNTTSKNITTPNNLKYIVDANGFAYNTSDITYQRLVPFSAGGTNDIRVDLQAGAIRITTFSSWSGYNAYLTIKYTKTTD